MPDTPPTNAEVEDQLKRILSSPRFRNALNPSDFLNVAVRRAMEGKKTAGRDIAASLFKDKFIAGESPDVRVTASNLRKTLQSYYEHEGCEDVIRIALPSPAKDKRIKPAEGEAYTPQFSYSENFGVMAGLRIGYMCLGHWNYTQHMRAYTIFADLLDEVPGHIGPTLGLIETFCAFEYRGWNNPMREDWFAYTLDAIKKLKVTSSGYWRLWAVLGYLHSVTNDNKRAGHHFKRALELDRKETELFLPYITFLIEQKHHDEAITLANNYMGLHFGDTVAVARFATFLVYLGRIQAAVQHLEAALRIDPGNTTAHELLAIIWLQQEDLDRVMSHVNVLKMLYDPISFQVAVAGLEGFEGRMGLEQRIAKAAEVEFSESVGVIVKR